MQCYAVQSMAPMYVNVKSYAIIVANTLRYYSTKLRIMTLCFSFIRVEQKKSSPPSFSDLLLMVRSEEDRQQAKASRMKKHMGATKQKAQLQFHGAYSCVPEESHETSLSAIEDLRNQVASLQSQLTSFMQPKRIKGGGNKGAVGKFTREPIKKNLTNNERPG